MANEYLDKLKDENGNSHPLHDSRISDDNITAWNDKQDKLTFDSIPTVESTNPVTSSGIKAAIDNIKTAESTILTVRSTTFDKTWEEYVQLAKDNRLVALHVITLNNIDSVVLFYPANITDTLLEFRGILSYSVYRVLLTNALKWYVAENPLVSGDNVGTTNTPVYIKNHIATECDSINNSKLTLKVGNTVVSDEFTANAGADFEYKITGDHIASALTAGEGISITGNKIATKLPISSTKQPNITKNVWTIIAMCNITNGVWERAWDFLLATNHNSASQFHLFISPRISASGSIETDTVVQIDGHITPAQLAKYKIATVKKDNNDSIYFCIAVNHTNSTTTRGVWWDIRNERGPSFWMESAPLSDYTVISERVLSTAMSSNRLLCYKQTHDSSVGSVSNPVYVSADGYIQKCTYSIVVGSVGTSTNTLYFI